jgi:hypothetical protein
MAISFFFVISPATVLKAIAVPGGRFTGRRGVSEQASRGAGVVDMVTALPGWREICRPELGDNDLRCCASSDSPSGSVDDLLQGGLAMAGDGTLPALVVLEFGLEGVPQFQFHLDRVARHARAGESIEGQVGQPGGQVGSRIALL